MNPFKWAKQQIAKAFESGTTPPNVGLDKLVRESRRQHPAKAQAIEATKKLQAEAIRRLRSPTQAQRRKWKWFHVSKWPIRGNPQSSEVTGWGHETYTKIKGPNTRR